MTATATIASTNMGVLLQDDVFVDFFNTFLNLPIFGQTPIYISSTGQWDLWPELPSHLDPSLPGLLTWLEKHRLPHFCKSSLCLHFVLCQKLLSFIRSEEAAKLLNWQSADQWLLEKCISGSRGMWRFRAFVHGLAGEELTKFWLTTERLLGLDKSDATQRKLYLSLLHALKATHLREGSRVVALCRTPVVQKTTEWRMQPIGTRRETLSKMQALALLKIQNYWLPNFFIHCKLSMEKEESCWPLLQEYQERLQADSQESTGSFSRLFTMHIKKSQALSGPYCSKKAKEEIWTLIKEGRGTQEMKMLRSFGGQSQKKPGPARTMCSSDTEKSYLDEDTLELIPQQSEHPANTAFGDKRGETSPKSCCPDIEHFLQPEELCEEQLLSDMLFSTPVVQPPSLLALKRPVKSSSSLSFLAWALSAEGCAGQPFREFLKRRRRPVETCLLDLWHDLEDFLCVVLGCSGEGSFLLRHLIGVRICKTYLEKGSVQHLPLEMRTLRNLQDHLPSGEGIPWIFKAQEEICKVLEVFYDEFLAEDDETFLQFVSPQSSFLMLEMQGRTVGKDEHFLLIKRINESLKLSQALYGMRDLENLSSEHWQLIATQDLRKGGSIQVELEPPVCRIDFQKMTFDELAVKNPLLAMDLLSENYKLFCLKFPSLAFDLNHEKKRTFPVSRTKINMPKSTVVILEKPAARPRSLSHWRSRPTGPGYFPWHWQHREHLSWCILLCRHFMEVLRNPDHLEFFKHFLKEHNTDGPLSFWLAVEKQAVETNPKRQRILINNIVRTYFHAKIPAEELLDCCASIIREISEAKVVSPAMLITAQTFVQKAMEERWFMDYQDLFPPDNICKPHLPLQHGMGNFKRDDLRRAWEAIRGCVKSICKFRREMNNERARAEFEDFLRKEVGNRKENLPINSTQSSSATGTSHSHMTSASIPQDKEMVLVKRRLFKNRLITVNFLVNDLHFYLEIDKFSKLADSAKALVDCSKHQDQEVAFLKNKVAIISDLFLDSDIPPKLRVNISEAQKDLIWSLSSKKILDRSLYYGATIVIFPILMHFWKRFCIRKAMKGFRVPQKKRTTISLPIKKTSSKSPVIYSTGRFLFSSRGECPIIQFTLLNGIQVLLPQAQKKKELSKKQKGCWLAPTISKQNRGRNQSKDISALLPSLNLYHRYQQIHSQWSD
ncbi:regulator of G-protein signaling protein-like [Apteryx mantelli]|uniref:Regulator of G-protein signaling protein-like n=1 Tax=Apteryx mantelli TaxID=2696672 RepID=A0ABM4EVN1_9AVES